MKRYSGIWENKRGDRIVIIETSSKTAACEFISGKTGQVLIRPYMNGSPAVDLMAELDYYESGIEINFGKGMNLCLDDPDYRTKAQVLTCKISRPYGKKYDYLSQYTELFSLESYHRIE